MTAEHFSDYLITYLSAREIPVYDGEPLKQLIGDYADHHHPVFDPLSQGFPLIDRLRAIERFHNTNNKISAFKLIMDN